MAISKQLGDREWGKFREVGEGEIVVGVLEGAVVVDTDNSIRETMTSANASSATSVVEKVVDKNIYIKKLIISVDTSMSVQLQDDAAGSPEVLMEQIYLPANSVFSTTFDPMLRVAENQDLDVITSGSGNISITVTGYQV